MKNSNKITILTAAVLLAASGGAFANTYTVTSTANSGAGSLSEAIGFANANPGADTITFNIASGSQDVSGAYIIQLTSVLPDITGPVTIDGYSQPGSAVNTILASAPQPGLAIDATLKVIVRGNGNTPAYGFRFVGQCPTTVAGVCTANTFEGADGSVVKGLSMVNFRNGAGANIGAIQINGANDIKITGNYIGFLPGGTVADFVSNARCVQVNSGSGTIIGGLLPEERNLILNGNESGGGTIRTELANNASVAGFTTQSRNTKVLGNIVGLDKTGETFVPVGSGAASTGPRVLSRGQSDEIGGPGEGRNVFTGTSANAIVLLVSGTPVPAFTYNPSSCPTTDTPRTPTCQSVLNNYIGTNARGTEAIGPINTAFKLVRIQAVHLPVVEGNLIAPRTGGAGGIEVQSFGNAGSGNVVLRGNLIGVMQDGVTPMPFSTGYIDGIFMFNENSFNSLKMTIENNVISGAGNPITGQGRAIRTNNNLRSDLANSVIQNNTLANNVGGISLNRGPNVAILSNIIYNNQPALGIDLSNNGITLNDLDPYTFYLLAGTDITAPGDPIVGSSANFPSGENPPNAIDDSSSTLYLNFDENGSGFVVKPSGTGVVTGMTITSANDVIRERDPKVVELDGWAASCADPSPALPAYADNACWVPITTIPEILFSDRLQKQGFPFANLTAYTYYRFKVVEVLNASAANSMYVAEVELLTNSTVVSNITIASDIDNGANHQQNFPILDAQHSKINPALSLAVGSLLTEANTYYLIEVFSDDVSTDILKPNPVCLPAPGYTSAACGANEFLSAQGKYKLGSFVVKTDANGFAPFRQLLMGYTGAVGTLMTSTASKMVGGKDHPCLAGDVCETSEFSEAVDVGVGSSNAYQHAAGAAGGDNTPSNEPVPEQAPPEE